MKSTAALALLAASGPGLAQPVNDHCSSATPIAGYLTVAFDNALATTDGLPNAACAFAGGSGIDHDVWYCWTAPETARVWLRTCYMASINSKIAVYDGCACPEGGGIIACNDDGCGIHAFATWNAEVGRSYLVRIGSAPGMPGGPGSFRLDSGPPPLVRCITNYVNTAVYCLFAPSSWDQANAAAFGSLVTINSAEENEFVRAQVLRFNQDRRGWIGLYDPTGTGSFVWVRGDPVTYTNWAPGEPDNIGIERWVELSSVTGLWGTSVNAPAGEVWGVSKAAQFCYADCNGDHALNVNDFICFQASFAHEGGDCNHDNAMNVLDFICFQAAFAAGCSAL